MAVTKCALYAREGKLDMEYIERRLDGIETRLDDLCGLIEELVERIDRGQKLSEPVQHMRGCGNPDCIFCNG